MAKVVLLLAIKKLKQLTLAEETTAYNEIRKLIQYLEDLQQKITTENQLPSDRVREVVALVYRIEDEIENSATSKSGKSSSRMCLLGFNILSSRHRDAIQIPDNSEVTRLCTKIKRLSSMVVLQRGVSEDNPESRISQDNRCQRQSIVVGKPFGLEEEKEQILKALLDTSNSFQAILIWGFRGTGKRTLARAIYDDPRVVEEFDKIIQIPVSENFDFRSALYLVLASFEDPKMKFDHLQTENLIERVRQHLENSRSLVLLEDVSSIEDWERLRKAMGAKRSSIVITTRAREVVDLIPAAYMYKKRPLTEENSWKLLKAEWSKIYAEAEIKPDMETRGKKMLELCKGIPGAIIALANLLARNDASEREIMLKNARSYLSQVMTPSYDDLPDESKLFFLYLGHFREDLEIETEKLSHLWTIEGLISPRECGSKMTLLDLTQKNLRVLAQKDMIEVQEMKESCRLVGLMGDMCVAKAEESGLLKVIDLRTEENLSSFSFSKTRRLVIYQGKYDGHGKLQHRNLRSLRIVKSDEQHQQLDFVWPWFIMSDIKKLHALRILDFDRMDFPEGKLPEDIFALTLLRYLSFKGCFIKELPSSISNLTYLQVLDLRINDLCKIVIPNVLRRMGRLQHLYLPRTFEMQNGEKLRLDALSELQTLKNFTPKVCEIRDLFKLAKLRYFYAKVEESPEDLKEIIDRLKHDSKKWRCSSLEIKNFDCYTEKRHNLFRDLLASGRSPKLFFEGYIDQLPPRNQISNEFTMIVLSSTQLKEDPLATLGKLPKLRRLVLQDDAFTGTKMVCSSLSFPELRQLEFSTLFSLVEWRVEDKAMLLLSHIKFENCMQLVLQNDLSFLDTLQEIKMKKMPEPFTKRLHDKFGKQGADQTDYWPVLI